MQKSELEKIKRKVMDEWIRMDIDCEEVCVCDIAVEMAIRKTAEAIFSKIGFETEDEFKVILDEVERGCYSTQSAVCYAHLDCFRKVLKKLKKQFLGEEKC